MRFAFLPDKSAVQTGISCEPNSAITCLQAPQGVLKGPRHFCLKTITIAFISFSPAAIAEKMAHLSAQIVTP